MYQARITALEELEAALRAPSFNNWPDLAKRLAKLIPTPKTPKGKRSEWADYKAPSWKSKEYESQRVDVLFRDGILVRVQISGHKRKPINWGTAWRVAQQFRKLRLHKLQGVRRTLEELSAFERQTPDCAVKSMRTVDGLKCRDVRNDQLPTKARRQKGGTSKKRKRKS